MCNKIFQVKYRSTERIADVYLRYLNKVEYKKKTLLSLNHLLKKERIYYDKDQLVAVISLLTEKGLIEKIENKYSVYTFSNAKKGQTLLDKKSDIEGAVNYYKLSKLGLKFTESNQLINIKNHLEKREKWKERIISFLVGVV